MGARVSRAAGHAPRSGMDVAFTAPLRRVGLTRTCEGGPSGGRTAPVVRAPRALPQRLGTAAPSAAALASALALAVRGARTAVGVAAKGGRRRRGVVRLQATATGTDTEAAISRWTSENGVVVFSKTWCPFCKKAKDALASVGAEFLAVELDEREDGDGLQAVLGAMTGARTVPRVFIGGKCVGGADDTLALLTSGELAALVRGTEPAAASPTGGAGAPLVDALQQSRPAHWALRTSDLRKSLDFLEAVCDMEVLRHEESEGPCGITSNGTHKGPWSKTIVGYGREHEAFCLGLTYNYGVAFYPAGAGLAHFGIGVDDPEAALETAARLGYKVEGDVVTGPDAYRFRLLPQPSNRSERFLYVALRVAELPKAADFYGGVFGMQDLTWDFEHLAFNRGGTDMMRVVGYSPDRVALMLFEDPTSMQELKLDQWDGRHVLSLPEAALRAAYEQLGATPKGATSVVHGIREFDDRLGRPTTAVIRDADGYEICMVASEVFDEGVTAVRGSAQDIDWARRRERAAASAA